jgi:hypothetical protein
MIPPRSEFSRETIDCKLLIDNHKHTTAHTVVEAIIMAFNDPKISWQVTEEGQLQASYLWVSPSRGKYNCGSDSRAPQNRMKQWSTS